MRLRLALAVVFDGPDPHGHCSLADSIGGRLDARHTVVIAARRRVVGEAGCRAADHNLVLNERMLRNTLVLVRENDQRCLNLVGHRLNVDRGLPLFCESTIFSPLSRSGFARGAPSNQGDCLLEDAAAENDAKYHEVRETSLWGSLLLAL